MTGLPMHCEFANKTIISLCQEAKKGYSSASVTDFGYLTKALKKNHEHLILSTCLASLVKFIGGLKYLVSYLVRPFFSSFSERIV